jgi:hypothetical protein
VDDNQLGPVRRVRVRRAPKYQAFIGVGAALGLLIALVSGFTGEVNADFSRRSSSATSPSASACSARRSAAWSRS